MSEDILSAEEREEWEEFLAVGMGSKTKAVLRAMVNRICAEVDRQSRDADDWYATVVEYGNRLHISGRTIRRLRRRWRWEKRRAEKWHMVADMNRQWSMDDRDVARAEISRLRQERDAARLALTPFVQVTPLTESLRADNERLAGELVDMATQDRIVLDGMRAERDSWRRTCEKMTDERDETRAFIADSRKCFDDLEQTCLKTCAERDALRVEMLKWSQSFATATWERDALASQLLSVQAECVTARAEGYHHALDSVNAALTYSGWVDWATLRRHYPRPEPAVFQNDNASFEPSKEETR